MAKKGIEGETFNIGTAERRTTVQVALAVVDALGAPRDLVGRAADRHGHVKSHAVSSAKIRRKTAWKPIHSFEKDVPRTVQWYAESRDWWSKTVLGSARAYFEERHPKLVAAVETAAAGIH